MARTKAPKEMKGHNESSSNTVTNGISATTERGNAPSRTLRRSTRNKPNFSRDQ